MAIAGEESTKCKAAKEVIKSLTSQVRHVHSRLCSNGCEPFALKHKMVLDYLTPLEVNGVCAIIKFIYTSTILYE